MRLAASDPISEILRCQSGHNSLSIYLTYFPVGQVCQVDITLTIHCYVLNHSKRGLDRLSTISLITQHPIASKPGDPTLRIDFSDKLAPIIS